jgi:GDP-4-dehydro-6-deoxy-D-mannose reductase
VNENILITGGTGFVGTHLVKALIEKNTPSEKIHVTSFGGGPTYLEEILPEENFHKIDLTEADAVLDLFDKLMPKEIYNLASFSAPGLSIEKKSLTMSVNTNIQLNMLEAVKIKTPSSRILAIGSGAEYAPSLEPLSETSPLGPRNPYAVSKVTQDMLAHSFHASHNLNIIRVRPFNHIGEYQATGFVVTDFVNQITKEIEAGTKKEIRVGNLDVTRDFTDVKDVVQAYILLMEKGIPGEVYNIGSGQDISIRDLLEKLKSLSTVDFEIIVDQDKKRSGDVERSIADISKIKKLGWEPTIPLDTTLQRIVKWWREK